MAQRIQKPERKSRGGYWWFLVLAGVLAVAYAIKYFTSGEGGSGLMYGVIGGVGLLAAAVGVVQAFRSGYADEPEKNDDDLRIT